MNTTLVITKNGVYCACTSIPGAYHIAHRNPEMFDLELVETFHDERFQELDEEVYVYDNVPYSTIDEARQACNEANPYLLDDDMPDFFSSHIEYMTGEEFIDFYNKGGKMK